MPRFVVAFVSLAGNVGVVSGISPPQNDRQADMSASCCRHDTDHVGDIAPCRLAGRRVGVVSAPINCDVSALCGASIRHVKKKNIVHDVCKQALS